MRCIRPICSMAWSSWSVSSIMVPATGYLALMKFASDGAVQKRTIGSRALRREENETPHVVSYNGRMDYFSVLRRRMVTELAGKVYGKFGVRSASVLREDAAED